MMNKNLKAFIQFDQQVLNLHLDKSTIADALYVQWTKTQLDAQTTQFQIWIHPKKNIILNRVVLQFEADFDQNSTFFCNGFQTWSESKLCQFHEKLDNLNPISRFLMKNYGDYHLKIAKPFRQKGALHSWTYSYLNTSNQTTFIGSLDETTGFTLIGANAQTRQISVEKEIENLELTHSFCALNILVKNAPPPVSNAFFDQYFDLYFDQTGIKPLKTQPATGWTSWYEHYQNISEKIILDNLNTFKQRELPIDIFQIDDGWQTAVGDWLSIDSKKFPNGLTTVARAIRADGRKAGLWLSPFIVAPNSKIFREKPHWLVRDGRGKLVRAGIAPHWSGWSSPFFYVLDFYNSEVQDYLALVFRTALHTWGFDMLKLDFLYAVCIEPRPNKTRGQIMFDAMQFVRQHAEGRLVLACGVPLGSAFGMVEFARVGADIHLSWEHNLLKWLRNRERVSTHVAMRTIVGRWELNGRAFLNDTDVFLLRNTNLSLSKAEKHTVFVLNCLLGKLLFTSDNVGDYDDETLDLYKKIHEFRDSTIQSVSFDNDFVVIEATINDKKVCVRSNLANFSQNGLAPHETRVE